MALITPYELQVAYVAFYGRPADKSDYEYWIQQEKDAAIAAISSSDEAKLMYAGKGEASAIDQIYQNLLGRDSDPDKLDSLAIQYKIDAAQKFTEALYENPTAAKNYNQNHQAGKDLLKGIDADSNPATVESAADAAITTAAQGGTSGEKDSISASQFEIVRDSYVNYDVVDGNDILNDNDIVELVGSNDLETEETIADSVVFA